jgi:hypothetical protein
MPALVKNTKARVMRTSKEIRFLFVNGRGSSKRVDLSFRQLNCTLDAIDVVQTIEAIYYPQEQPNPNNQSRLERASTTLSLKLWRMAS